MQRLLITGALAPFLSLLPAQQPGTPGERVPATAISPLVLEPMSVVLERQRSGRFPAPPTPAGWNGQDGRWHIPSRSAKTPAHSGTQALANEWGDPRMSIGFPQRVDVTSIWAAGHGVAPARAVRMIAYRGGAEVARTAWFALGTTPELATLGFTDIDRLDFEAAPTVAPPMAFFALDDLRLAPTGQPTLARTLDFEDLTDRTIVTGTAYAGLQWPAGNGFRVPLTDLDVVPAPRTANEPAVPDSPAGTANFGGSDPTPPRVWNDYQGVVQGDPGANLIPPDTCGATGPDHTVMIVNSNLSVFSKATGARLVNVGLNAFWGSTGTTGDPRSVYDPHAQRFILLAETFSAGLFYYAISQTADPSGSWFKFSFDTRQGVDAGRWPDYVTLGVDARGIYSAAYMVGASVMTIFAIDKAPLLATVPSVGTITAFRGLPWEGAIQPCMTYGDPGRQYLVSRQSSTLLRVRHVLPPLTSPVLVETGSVAVSSHGNPPSAPALGSTTNISTLDTRPMNAVYRNGSIWVAQGISFGGRAACRWYEIDTAPLGLAQFGTVADPVWHYYYPSISVDSRGHVGFGFSGSHAGVYCSSFVTGRHAADPAGTMAPPILTKAGENAWNRLDGSGRNRFGDYSFTDVDPVDDRGFWSYQEFIGVTNNQWRTRFNRFGFEASNYGVGLAGTSGVPTLRTAARPFVGQTMGVQVGHSGGLANAPGILLLGFATAALPQFGGTVLVDALVSTPVAVQAPFTNVAVTIPADPALSGVSIYFQAGQLDPAAVQLVAMSPGLEVVFGSR